MTRHRLVALFAIIGVAGAVLLVVTTGLVPGREPAPTEAAPPQATEAITVLLGGDRDAVRAVLSPPLAAALAGDQPPPPAEPVEVELVDWVAAGPFAGATALVGPAGDQIEMDVGFRLVDGDWLITYTQVRP